MALELRTSFDLHICSLSVDHRRLISFPVPSYRLRFEVNSYRLRFEVITVSVLS
jgi:hypothetical protein